MKCYRKFAGIISICALICFSSIVNATCPSSKDYDRQNNPVNLINYGYANPIDGFVGSYLLHPFRSSHYLSGKTHLGVDFMTTAGTHVYAICDGIVVESQDMTYQKNVRHRNNYNAYFSSRIIIQCTCDTESFLVIYGHVDNSLASVGDSVTKGEKIAEIAPAYYDNNQRWVKNDHLHFGVNTNDSITYVYLVWGFGIGQVQLL